MMAFNVLGFGVMGRQIIALLRLTGHDVFVWNHHINDDVVEALHTRDFKLINRYLKQNGQVGNVYFVKDIANLYSLITFEVLAEDIEIKRRVISSLPYEIAIGSLFTNTSSYSPSEIHKNAIGLHFFNPIYVNKFFEITCSVEALSLDIRDLIDKLINHFGFEYIVTSDNRGYIGNYLVFREIASVLKLIEKYGYNTEAIDRVLNHMGRTSSIFDIIDLVGIDVCRKIILNLKEEDPSVNFPVLLDCAISKNIFGRKNKTSIRSLIDEKI